MYQPNFVNEKLLAQQTDKNNSLYNNGAFLLAWYNKLKIVNLTYVVVSGYNSFIYLFFCLKIIVTLANSV